MPDTYTANEDGSYTVVNAGETQFINFTAFNPETGYKWGSMQEVKTFVAAHPNVWSFYSSLPTQEEQDAMTASKHRMTRNQLLADSDWTQFNDSPLNNDTKVLWATYRSSLRSLPEHENWPNLADEDWPIKPS